MAAKKTTGKKTPGRAGQTGKGRKTTAAKTRRTAGRKKSQKTPVSIAGRFLRNLGVLVVFVVVSFGAGAGIYLIRHMDERSAPEETPVATAPDPSGRPAGTAPQPKFEVFPDEPEVAPEQPEPAVPPDPERRPRVAIIVDDLGYDLRMAERFLDIDAILTYSVLPHSPYARQIANAASLNGSEVMLHLPMEPDEYPEVDPGPGALLSGMTPDERIRLLQENLDAVPFISGVNNHMGSKMSANDDHMNQVLSIIKKRGLFYIDSVTTHNSRAHSSARLFQVPFARRDVFLDHDPDPEAIRNRIDQLVGLAELNGHAIGIAHPYETTYRVLAEKLPKINDRVLFIPASEAVRLAAY